MRILIDVKNDQHFSRSNLTSADTSTRHASIGARPIQHNRDRFEQDDLVVPQ